MDNRNFSRTLSVTHKAVLRTAAAGLSMILLLTGATWSASAETPPGLSITIDNGATETAPNSEVTYSTTLANSGTKSVVATIVVSVPAFATITKAPEGKIDGVDATWTVTVKPGAKKSVSTTAHIGVIPEGEYRTTVLASVYLGKTATGAPVIRSADADKIPGVADPVVGTAKSSQVTSANTTGQNWILPTAIGVGAGIVVVAAAALIIARRRRRVTRRRRDDHTPL